MSRNCAKLVGWIPVVQKQTLSSGFIMKLGVGVLMIRFLRKSGVHQVRNHTLIMVLFLN